MSKINSLNIVAALEPFKTELGAVFPKIVNDIQSMLGRAAGQGDKGIEVDLKDWKATAGFKIKRTTGESLQLPPNNAGAILLCFGMRLNEIAKAGEMEVQATIPKNCEAWVTEHSRKARQQRDEEKEKSDATGAPIV